MKGSRFIVDVAAVVDEVDARQLLDRVRTEFPDASHHCSAWCVADPAIDRASDDGEPHGSAGRPILAQIQGRDLVNVAVVVTRYFGGTKLGVGGLVRAYGSAAGQALDTLDLTPWVAETTVSFAHDYAHTDAVERAVERVGAAIIKRSFEAEVIVKVRIQVDAKTDLTTALSDLSAGAISLDEQDDD